MRTTGAYILRENTGTSGLEPTLRSAVQILARHETPQFVALEKLISLKLDSWSNTPTRRHKDQTDVIELIEALHLPRTLPVDDPVRALYVETWDALATEH